MKDYWPLVLSGPRGFRPTVSYLNICTLTNSSWSFVPMLLKQRACFLDSSAGRESTCNAGDPDSIPGSGRSTGEGIGYPLQYSGTSLVAQLVKNLPAMQVTWVWSLGREDALEKGMATHSSILPWRIPWIKEPCGLQSIGSQRVEYNWMTKHIHIYF